MMKKLFSLLLILLSFTSTFSQTTEIKGRVVDANTGEGLAYASITVFNRPEVTYTNTDGSFSLKILKNRITDTAFISNVGYPGTTVTIKDLDNAVIKLTKMAYTIDEVAVTAKRKKRKTITINPINRTPKHYDHLMPLYTWNDTIINNKLINRGTFHYVLIYVPYDSMYDRYKYIKEVTVLQHLHGINPDRDSPEDILWKTRSRSEWKLRIRILKAEPNEQQTGLDARHNHHPGEDVLFDNVIATKNNAKYELDIDLDTQSKLTTMSSFEKTEYLNHRWTPSLGEITANLEKYKIIFPKTGIYYGIEYLGPNNIFYLCEDSSKEIYFAWSLFNGKWNLEFLTEKDGGWFAKPAISLLLSE